MSLGDELPQPVTAVVDAVNNGDEDAFVAAFVPEGYVDDWGRVLRGADGARSKAQPHAIGMNASMTVLSVSTDDRPATCSSISDFVNCLFGQRLP